MPVCQASRCLRRHRRPPLFVLYKSDFLKFISEDFVLSLFFEKVRSERLYEPIFPLRGRSIECISAALESTQKRLEPNGEPYITLCMIRPLLLACAALFSSQTASAQIYADVETTMGTFTIELDYTNSPLAVANFIGLAEGTQTWIDATTGAARVGEPFYDGIIFHRVIEGFMNQVGSPNGLGTDGPGYSFPDELDTSYFSQAYNVAMANSGPNSNGSQIFITVDSTTWLNDLHTVFGTVPADDGASGIVDGSRNVINAINSAPVTNNRPNTPIEIISVTIRRIGVAAQNFDASAQALPAVIPTIPTIRITEGNEPYLEFEQQTNTLAYVSLSSDLSSWTAVSREHGELEVAPLTQFDPTPFQSDQDQQFYRVTIVDWPTNAVFPESLANQTLVINLDTVTTPFTFIFNETGTGGTWSYPAPGNSHAGTITSVGDLATNRYGFELNMSLGSIDFDDWNLRLDTLSASANEITGSSSGLAVKFDRNSAISLNGTFTLTR